MRPRWEVGDMISLFLRYLAKKWQQRCSHPRESVSFDILDGGGDQHVSHCHLCGAAKVGFKGTWRHPNALYHPYLDTVDLVMRLVMPSAFPLSHSNEE